MSSSRRATSSSASTRWTSRTPSAARSASPRDAEPIITGILKFGDGLLGTSLPDTLGWDATTYILTGTGRRELTPGERAALGDLADRFPLLR